MPLLSKKIFFFLFIIISSLHAQIIESIEITGNDVFNKQEILSWSEINEGMRVYPGITDSIKKHVLLNLGYRGYFHGYLKVSKNISKEDSQKVNLDINISEGEPTYVSKIYFMKKDSSFGDEIENMFNDLKGQIFNKFEIEDNINNILTLLENKGYPFSKITINSTFFYFDSTENEYFVDLHLNLDKQLMSKIDKIEVSGNTKTKPYVITRELRLEKGELYSQKIIDNIPSKLNKLRFFEPVETPKFYFNSKNEGVLIINVKEKQTNNFDGIIGYIPPPAQGEKGYITGLVNISLRNLIWYRQGSSN